MKFARCKTPARIPRQAYPTEITENLARNQVWHLLIDKASKMLEDGIARLEIRQETVNFDTN